MRAEFFFFCLQTAAAAGGSSVTAGADKGDVRGRKSSTSSELADELYRDISSGGFAILLLLVFAWFNE